jgi:hypothetical protein
LQTYIPSPCPLPQGERIFERIYLGGLMKKSLLLVVAVALFLGACACCNTLDREKIKQDSNQSFKAMDSGNTK